MSSNAATSILIQPLNIKVCQNESWGQTANYRSNKEAIFQSNSRFLSSTFGVNSATLIKLLSTELWLAKSLIFHSNITINDNLGKEMLTE